MLLNIGVQQLLGRESPAQASTATYDFSIQSDGVLLSLNVIAVTGTLDVSVYNIVGVDTLLLHQFTTVVAPTADPVQWQSATIGSALRVVVTTSGAAQYELFARAVSPVVTLDEPIAVTLDEPIDVVVTDAAPVPGPTGYTQALVSVSTTAVELFTGGSRDPNRQLISIFNDGAGPVFLGPLGVTASGATKGRQLSANQTTSFPIGDAAVYAIAGSGTRNLIVEEWAP